MSHIPNIGNISPRFNESIKPSPNAKESVITKLGKFLGKKPPISDVPRQEILAKVIEAVSQSGKAEGNATLSHNRKIYFRLSPSIENPNKMDLVVSSSKSFKDHINFTTQEVDAMTTASTASTSTPKLDIEQAIETLSNSQEFPFTFNHEQLKVQLDNGREVNFKLNPATKMVENDAPGLELPKKIFTQVKALFMFSGMGIHDEVFDSLVPRLLLSKPEDVFKDGKFKFPVTGRSIPQGVTATLTQQKEGNPTLEVFYNGNPVKTCIKGSAIPEFATSQRLTSEQFNKIKPVLEAVTTYQSEIKTQFIQNLREGGISIEEPLTVENCKAAFREFVMQHDETKGNKGKANMIGTLREQRDKVLLLIKQ